MFKKIVLLNFLFLSQQIMPSYDDEKNKRELVQEETQRCDQGTTAQAAFERAYAQAAFDLPISSSELGFDIEPFWSHPWDIINTPYFAQQVAYELLRQSTTKELQEFEFCGHDIALQQPATAEEIQALKMDKNRGRQK